jgi:hypothetical protein
MSVSLELRVVLDGFSFDLEDTAGLSVNKDIRIHPDHYYHISNLNLQKQLGLRSLKRPTDAGSLALTPAMRR